MSHDQRPARMRLVSDGSGNARRRATPVTIEGDARVVAQTATSGAAPASAGALPMLAIILFLLACVAGGACAAYFTLRSAG
ncbi:hypothetical protein [uncultured Sphingomonas sp.]|uniref:hypothetical protein n=1 Tax=uncultured Sphingomonas sp. TaxID=158754 RepID=UPI0026304D5A|nr:hypothetical protein [uncultured Sphingomonas sp.]